MSAAELVPLPELDRQTITDAEQLVWRYFVLTNEHVMSYLNRNLASFNVSPGEYRVLLFLYESRSNSRRMSDLASITNQPPSRLSHIVKRMEDRGLVKRAAFKEDRRGTVVTITEEGAKLLCKVQPTHIAAIKRIFVDAIGEEEYAAFGAALERVFEAVTPVMTHSEWSFIRGISDE